MEDETTLAEAATTGSDLESPMPIGAAETGPADAREGLQDPETGTPVGEDSATVMHETSADPPAADSLDLVPGEGPEAIAPGMDPASTDPSGLLTLPEQAHALLQTGGPVMYILVVLSVLALTILFVKLWQYLRVAPGARRPVREALDAWQAGRHQEAIACLNGRRRNPIVAIVHTAMIGHRQGAEPALLREEIERQAGQVLGHLRGHLRGLELIAALSPLLGLLGTVIGMIAAFQALEMAGHQVDPAVLSGGIWVALLTTAAGLSVAIPAVAALNGLERLVDGVARHIEDAVTRVFTADLTLSEARSGHAPIRQEPARRREAAHAT
ncbi:MotA/TolQ/ExbB proton channel family protein [Thioalkalicoccus limnaeus]|uniref:MotA/TolQ/ExbB proton channel family protein n=1 Tax=Thioalkalicoccus limnaeus TaxID=120681 RepID=A0ABV4BFA2_9GAMM